MPSHYKHDTHGQDYIEYSEKKKKKKKRESTNKSTQKFIDQLKKRGDW